MQNPDLPTKTTYALVPLLPREQLDISRRESIRRRKVKRAEQAAFLRSTALRIIEAVAKRSGVPMERVFLNVHRYGNMSAGTVPVALVEAL